MFLLAFVQPIKVNDVPRSKAGPGKARLGLPGRLPTERTIPSVHPAGDWLFLCPPAERPLAIFDCVCPSYWQVLSGYMVG